MHPTNRLPSSAPFSEPCEHLFGQQESPLALPESTRGPIPRTRQRCCRCEDAAQHVQRRWPVSSEQTTRDGSLWTPTTLQRGCTCAREQTQATTTSMGSRAMVAEHAPHHTLVFHGVGACSRARWTARPLRRTGRHCKASSTISPRGSARETCCSSCQERAMVPDAWLGGMTRSQLVHDREGVTWHADR
jgi:hypothetical protein